MVKKGRLIPLTVEGYASDGAGIARLDGLVIFVKGGIRGERCAVRIDKVGRSAVWGHAEEILSPSSARIEPECPYFGVCGGCQLRHMTYGEELELKRSRRPSPTAIGTKRSSPSLPAPRWVFTAPEVTASLT